MEIMVYPWARSEPQPLDKQLLGQAEGKLATSCRTTAVEHGDLVGRFQGVERTNLVAQREQVVSQVGGGDVPSSLSGEERGDGEGLGVGNSSQPSLLRRRLVVAVVGAGSGGKKE